MRKLLNIIKLFLLKLLNNKYARRHFEKAKGILISISSSIPLLHYCVVRIIRGVAFPKYDYNLMAKLDIHKLLQLKALLKISANVRLTSKINS